MRLIGQADKRRGFTLIELLIAIAIVSILAAVIFPTFFTAREKARRTTCISNLRQIGHAIAIYMQDSDGVFPWAADASDKNTNIWASASNPQWTLDVQAMPLLNDLLFPYLKSKEVWRCPSDSGFVRLDTNIGGDTGVALNSKPDMYTAFNSSYLYRTEIALRRTTETELEGVQIAAPHKKVGPAEINLLMDGCGRWHGTRLADGRRYNVLMADGHIATQNPTQFFITSSWGISLQ